MTLPREPRLHPVPIAELRPTQITVGMREVEAKRKQWRNHPDRKKPDFLGRHMIPVVLGPKERSYVIDHHHLSLALCREGVNSVATTVVADLRRLSSDAFWTFLDNRGWLHPYDAEGRRCDYADIPKRLVDLIDDPYRSLAGELRRRLPRKLVHKEFAQAAVQAMKLAKTEEANFLPGWCGPIRND